MILKFLPGLFASILVFIFPSVVITAQDTPARDSDLLPVMENLAVQSGTTCELPCWWNIRTGETTLEEVEALYLASGFDRVWKTSSYAETIPFKTFIEGESITLFFEVGAVLDNYRLSLGFDPSDVVSAVQMSFTYPERWLPDEYHLSFPDVLQTFDSYPEVVINRHSSSGDFSIYLTYLAENIRLRYSFEVENYRQNNMPYIRLCPDLKHTGQIEIQIQKDAFEVLPASDFSSPDEILLTPAQAFLEFFRRNPNRCLRVRSNF